MKTHLPKKMDDNKRAWVLVDATDQIVGRLAVKIANMLRGKDKPIFTPQVDMGDFVVVVNAAKVKLTGKKETQKEYKSYSGFRDGLKLIKAKDMRVKHPEQMITLAVRRMLPKNRLSATTFKRLKVYAGAEHPHTVQKPIKVA